MLYSQSELYKIARINWTDSDMFDLICSIFVYQKMRANCKMQMNIVQGNGFRFWWSFGGHLTIRPGVTVLNIWLQCTPHTIALDRWRQQTMVSILFSKAAFIAHLCQNTVIETPAVPAIFLTSFLHVEGKITINTVID